MLAELQRYCPNRSEGCTWVGDNEHCSAHVQSCTFRPRAQLTADLDAAQAKISRLREKLSKAEKKIEILTAANAELAHTNAINERKLRVYNAFLEAKDDQPRAASDRTDEGRPATTNPDSDSDPDPHDLLGDIGASVGSMTVEERERHEASIMQKLARLRALHGSLADVAQEQTSKIASASAPSAVSNSSSSRGRK